MFNRNRETGWSKPEVACKRHQNHKQLQGVCPFCLRERLSQLAAASLKKSSMVSSHSCNSSSQSSSPASSSGGNTSLGRRLHNRNVSEISFMLSGGGSSSNGLKKSRSMAFVPRKFVGEIKNGKKKNGFWSKLLHRERKKEIFMA